VAEIEDGEKKWWNDADTEQCIEAGEAKDKESHRDTKAY